MKPFPLIFTAALATSVSLGALTLGCAYAAETAPNKTDPGFVPGTGQINPGTPRVQDSRAQAVAAEKEKKIPSMKEASAAFHSPTPKGPAIGHMPSQPQPTSSAVEAQSANAIGGPMRPGASASNASGGSSGSGGASQGAQQNAQPATQQNGQGQQETQQGAQGANAASGATTGKGEQAPSGQGGGPAHEAAPSEWPVGSLNQTAPAKFSERNDTLDRFPIMGWFTLTLSDEERQRIFTAVMGEQGAPSADADKLKVASQVTTQQALNEMKPLPQSLAIEHVKTLGYLKGKDKVLLVEPATRVVVGELTK